jgi:hypothetical protein
MIMQLSGIGLTPGYKQIKRLGIANPQLKGLGRLWSIVRVPQIKKEKELLNA